MGDAQRWRRGSKKRNELRALCRRKGRCTTCFGKGRWWIRPHGHRETTVEKICPNCGGTGNGSGGDHRPNLHGAPDGVA